jgi:YXWGXW repeat-containing protein
MRCRWLSTSIVAGGLLLAGCYVAPAPVVQAPPAPPPPQVEAAPPVPGPAYVWVAGRWTWRGPRRGYVWVPGYYAVPAQPGWVWVPGYWAHTGAGYVWVDGHWRAR